MHVSILSLVLSSGKVGYLRDMAGGLVLKIRRSVACIACMDGRPRLETAGICVRWI